jgi:DeoR/GlpR family transcriptional regulator of sugar metabolism
LGLDVELPLSVRETKRIDEKSKIAQSAVNLINDGDTIIMDSSSTVMRMADYLQNKADLTIITNGAKTAVKLAEQIECKLYCTGGRMRENTLTFFGESANSFIEKFNADKVFLSCGALSMKKGITDSHEEEGKLRRLMIDASKTAVLLCDHTKFDTISFCKICDVKCVEYIITDTMPSLDWVNYAERKNLRLIAD